ncbi:Metallopeptidase, catalytic domain [Ceraceosorus bombacis]|uniref:Metallopeptidase, catalytic domain n=1 Tax=Ceraceosorus bombacis TaxID=401625 RepID=A0A0P1BJS6_9BASI|nr:Metallopeptidase, catalytic domain [Ceraceosorus bombacis]
MKFTATFLSTLAATVVTTAIARPYVADPTVDDANFGVFARQDAVASNETFVPPTITSPASRSLQPDFPIHESCNKSQRMQLERGLFDLKRLLRGAADHILLHGNQSEVYQTYFGEGSDPSVPLGIYLRVLESDKSATLFRCDDPDRNCETQPTYNGHWRGNNATGETVICPLSFQTRLPIEKACANGFSLIHDNVNVYWATDLLHRAMHLPTMTNDHVGHTADEYPALLDLAKNNVTESVKNQHSLQDFAFEAFVRANIDEQGCPADRHHEEHDHDHDHDHDDHDLDASPTSTISATSTSASATAAAQDCHTHADGTVHCV